MSLVQTLGLVPDRLAFRLLLAVPRSAYRLMLVLEFQRRQRQRLPHFIICTLRSGSNLLLSYLNSVPGLSFAGEVLHPHQVQGLPRHGVSKGAVIRHLRYSLNHCRSERCGVKLPADHLEWHGLDVRELREHFPSSRMIILYRRSLADQYLSLQVARLTRRWMRRNRARLAPPTGRIRIDREDFVRYCSRVRDFYSEMMAVDGISSYAVVLSYEELVANAQEVFDRKLFSFLGLAPVEVTTNLVKSNRQHPSQMVENYEAVRDLWEEPEFVQEYA